MTMEITMKRAVTIAFTTALAWAMTACVVQDDTDVAEMEEVHEEQEPELSEISSELTIGGYYCVRQSYASAERLGGYANVCWRSPLWSTTLSYGHKVTAVTSCAYPSSACAIVHSHWNHAYYYMRKDALSPC